jgi:hypothetical protein
MPSLCNLLHGRLALKSGFGKRYFHAFVMVAIALLKINNSTHKGMEFLGMEKSHQCPMPNVPSRRAAVPFHPQGDGVSRRLPMKKYRF